MENLPEMFYEKLRPYSGTICTVFEYIFRLHGIEEPTEQDLIRFAEDIWCMTNRATCNKMVDILKHLYNSHKR